MTISRIIEEMPAVSLEETVERAALLNRMDTKFLLMESELRQILEVWQQDYRVLDISGSREFRYESTYLDTAELELLRWHVQGRRRRAKCRVRTYVDTGQKMLEVKVKGRRGETVKYRKPVSSNPTPHDCSDYLQQSLMDAYSTARVQYVRPTLRVDYRRITLISADFLERITLDHALVFTALDENKLYEVPEDVWIVEKKSASAHQKSTCPLKRGGHRPLNISKYVLGMSLLQTEVPSNEYRPIHRLLSTMA